MAAQDKKTSQLTVPVSIADLDVAAGYRPGTGGAENLNIQLPVALIRSKMNIPADTFGPGSQARSLTDRLSVGGMRCDVRDFIPNAIDGTTDNLNGLQRAMGIWKVNTITRSGTTATITVGRVTNLLLAIGSQFDITVNGITQTEYNGNFVGTVTSATTITYTVSGAPTTPGTALGGDSMRVRLVRTGLMHLDIPPGIYACGKALHIPSDVIIDNHGELKYIGPNTEGGFLWARSESNIWFRGGRYNANGIGNINIIAVSATDTNPYNLNIHIHNITCVGARSLASLEATNAALYSGGGKGITIQFKGKGVQIDSPILDDCDIGISIEAATSDGRIEEGVVITNPVFRNNARCSLFFSGGNPPGESTADPGSSGKARQPGVVIIGGMSIDCATAQIAVPGDTTYENYQINGVIAGKVPSGVSIIGHKIVNAARVTIMRGEFQNCHFDLTIMADELESVFNFDPIPTLDPSATDLVCNNDFTARVQCKSTAGFYGYLIDGGIVNLNKTRYNNFIFRTRGVPTTKLVRNTSVLGTFNEFNFLEMETGARLTGNTASTVDPTDVTFPAAGEWRHLGSFQASNSSSGTKIFAVALVQWRKSTARNTLLAGSPSGGDFGLGNTAGQAVQGTSTNNTSATDAMQIEVAIPAGYVSGGAFAVKVRAKVGSTRAVTQTVNLSVKRVSDGGVSSDLTSGTAQSVTASFADYTFTVTPTTLVAGDQLLLVLTGVNNDTGGSTAAVISVSRVTLEYTSA